MRTNTSTTKHVTVTARIAVVVIALVLGHDALMALPVQADTSEHAGHHGVSVEMCVASDVTAAQAPGTPLLPTFSLPTVAFDTAAVFAFIAADHSPIIAIDGSTQRALLQVFLN
ncbi:MAG: hypothetical protein M9953_06405 [Thermomicrobiales bacterium]|nr:hypothetical protein [Thermomicrobiales bacterium]MCO5218260.1 hypothetical protein [Thermomicrobiales bacterium]MCO5224951.1 hypothetical protein [Thermomicrobiales bacterium]MCO5227757.1 hypothetical protein [Thermomicrobiales bacterium]